MKPRPKLEILPPLPREFDPATLDAFHEYRVRQDLATLARTPGMLAKYVERARIRFQKASERAVLEHWINFYQTGERLITARAAMERAKSDFLQLPREYEVKDLEKSASLAKLQADIEEHNLRRYKAINERQRLETSSNGTNTDLSDDEQNLNSSQERRLLDVRWNLHESLSALNNLIELQHWRRQQRDRILADRSLTSQEQGEDLQFVDDLYEQKRAELKVDTRIFEGT